MKNIRLGTDGVLRAVGAPEAAISALYTPMLEVTIELTVLLFDQGSIGVLSNSTSKAASQRLSSLFSDLGYSPDEFSRQSAEYGRSFATGLRGKSVDDLGVMWANAAQAVAQFDTTLYPTAALMTEYSQRLMRKTALDSVCGILRTLGYGVAQFDAVGVVPTLDHTRAALAICELCIESLAEMFAERS